MSVSSECITLDEWMDCLPEEEKADLYHNVMSDLLKQAAKHTCNSKPVVIRTFLLKDLELVNSLPAL